MTDRPLVSVVIPSFESATHIGAAIGSVLDQTMTDHEVVVVDDGSRDGTLAVVRSFRDPRVRVLADHRRVGAAGNWNRAIDAARGRFVKLLCGDDVLYPRCLERQAEVLTSYPDVAIVACRRDIVGVSGRVLLRGRGLAGMAGVVPGDEAIRHTVLSGTNTLGEPAAVMVRAEVLARCGPFSDKLPYVIDLDMWLRVLAHGDLFALDETLCAFRVLGRSWSVQLAPYQCRDARVLFRRVRERHPTVVTAWHERVGGLRAGSLAAGRRTFYRVWARDGGPRPQPARSL